jgi:hypothetical protein
MDWRSRLTPATDRHSVAPNYVAGIVSRMLEIDGTKLWAYVLRQRSRPVMDETTIRMAIRATARISFVLFLGAFLGNALYRLVPASATRWLKANKDGFVLGFAASHTVHIAFILALVAAIGREQVFKGIMVVAFTTGFLFIYAQKIPTTGATINVVSGGQGPPLLLLHGNPETHVMWYKVAPRLATEFSVFAADLRGYGDSSKPEGGEDHSNYSKTRNGNGSDRIDEPLWVREVCGSGTRPWRSSRTPNGARSSRQDYEAGRDRHSCRPMTFYIVSATKWRLLSITGSS